MIMCLQAVKLGLVDGIHNIFEVLDRKFGGNVSVYEASRRPSMIGNIMSRLMPIIPFFKVCNFVLVLPRALEPPFFFN